MISGTRDDGCCGLLARCERIVTVHTTAGWGVDEKEEQSRMLGRHQAVSQSVVESGAVAHQSSQDWKLCMQI